MEEDISHRRTNYTFLFLTALNIFILSAHLSPYIQGIKYFLFYIVSPAPIAASKLVLGNQKILQNIQELISVHQENLALRLKLVNYVITENELKNALEENARLKSLIAFPMPDAKKAVFARIIKRDPQQWFQWIIIDKGSNDGISLDAAVLAWSENKLVVLGRAREVYDRYSKVAMVTNVLFAVPALIGSTQEDGLIEGENGPWLKLDFLQPKEKITLGEEIVTSPLSSVFPQGLLIGTVQDIKVEEDADFQTAIVKPAINSKNIREVVVLIQEKR